VKIIRNNAIFFFKSIEKMASALRMAQTVLAVKENFTSDIFRLLKSQDKNLEIVYANIRV
jgi:uncharacterized protein YvpB